MTLADLKNAATEAEARYYELGGKKELFAEFMSSLEQAIDFELVAEWVETPVGLVGQFFNDRYRGIKEKFDIREVVGKRESDAGKTYSFLDKKWK